MEMKALDFGSGQKALWTGPEEKDGCVARGVAFIRRISTDHPEYGEDRIALELEVKFGLKHSTATIRKYMVKPAKPRGPSQSWRTFLKNQPVVSPVEPADAIWMCDFCVQHTVRFTALYIFVILDWAAQRSFTST